MKKTLKVLALVLAIGLVLIALAGCGEDKLVATKTTEDSFMGTYQEEIVVTFKKDEVDTVKMSMEFDNEESAKSMKSLYDLGMSMSEEEALEGMEVKVEGKKLVITMDAKAFAKSGEVSSEDMSKDAIRKSLEESGYEVK